MNIAQFKNCCFKLYSLYKYIIAKLQALTFIQRGFRGKSSDFCELYFFRQLYTNGNCDM